MSIAKPRIALVVSRFNQEVTSGLLNGARAVLVEAGLAPRVEDVFDAPGAFEIPVIAKSLAKTGRYDGVICLGCVIKGETAHFEFISLTASMGLMTGALEIGIPLSFGILTVYDESQAKRRSQPGPENKGREAAIACLDTVRLLARVRKQLVS